MTQALHPEKIPSSNLPVAATSFVGRTRELERIDALMRSHRVVTVAGGGGMGKTRLAVQYAGAAAAGFPDGAWFVSLKEVRQPDRIARAVADALGLGGTGGAGALLAEHLWKARALLVLDNAEHVTAAVARFIGDLLERAPHVRVLVTSREILHLAQEQVLWLTGIDDGVRLFTERAAPDASNLELSDGARDAVANICAKLQGIPLAIELAAARVASVSPHDLIEVLDDLPALDTALGPMLDWSFGLLGRDERDFFCALGLFDTSFSWEAVDAVASPDGGDALSLLEALVGKSLVVGIDRSQAAGYYLLDVVREYARSRLRTSGHEPAYVRRYVDYHLSYVESSTGLTDESRMSDRLEREWPNVEAALRRALERNVLLPRARSAISKLWRFWYMTGRAREGLSWIDRALGTGTLSERERVELIDAAARMAATAQDFPRLESLAQSLVSAREPGENAKLFGDALFMLANAKNGLGNFEAAEPLYQRAREQFEIGGSRRGVAMVLGTLGTIIEQQTVDDPARFEEARRLLESALEIFRDERVQISCGQMLENLGVLSLRRGELGQALSYMQESMSLYRQYGNRPRAAMVHIGIADVYLERSQPLQALEELTLGRRALGRDARGRFVPYYAEAAFKAAVCLGEYDAGAKLYGFAVRYRQLIHTPLQASEEAALSPPRTAAREALGSAAFDAFLTEGTQWDVSAVDAAIARLASSSKPAPVQGRRAVLPRERVTMRLRDAAAFPAVFVTAGDAWGKSVALDHYLESDAPAAFRLQLDEVGSAHADRAGAIRTAAADAARLRGVVVVENLHAIGDDERTATLLFELVREYAGTVRWIFTSRTRGQPPVGTCLAYGLAGRPVDERDLAFTAQETISYAGLLRVELSEEEATEIVELTEGWPTAVQLALQAHRGAIAMAPIDRRTHVERETVSLASFYFREKVFRTLSEEEQRCLLTAGAMPGDVHAGVLRQLYPRVERILAELCRTTPLRGIGDGVFRLPPLFKRFLRNELAAWPQWAKAGEALAGAYERDGDLSSAIAVSLEAGLYERALRMLVENAQAWANSDWPDMLEDVVARLPARWLETNPAVLLARAALLERGDRIDEALELLRRASDDSGGALSALIANARAALCLRNGRPAASARLDEAIAVSPEGSLLRLRTAVLTCVARAGESREEEARRSLRELLPGVDALVVDEENVDVVYWAAEAYFRLGEYESAKRLAARIASGEHRDEPWLVLAQAADVLSRIAFQTEGPVDAALRANAQAIATARRLNDGRYYAAYFQWRCVLLAYNGAPNLLEAAANESHADRRRISDTYAAAFRFSTLLHAAERSDTLESATVLYGEALPLARTLATDSAFAGDSYLARAAYMMAATLCNDPTIAEYLDSALEDAAEADAHAIERPARRRHASMMTSIAILCQTFAGGRRSLTDVLDGLVPVTEDAAAGAVAGIARSIVSSIRTKKALDAAAIEEALAELGARGYGTTALLLKALARKSSSVNAAGVALSKTESAILVQLAAGLSAAEIAQARHLSVNTVQTHVKNLYRKLGVNSAAAAVNRGRSLGLV